MLDIQARHRTLAGDDLFTGLVVAPRQRPPRVRARGQGKLVRLRALYLELAGSTVEIRELMLDSAEDVPARDARAALPARRRVGAARSGGRAGVHRALRPRHAGPRELSTRRRDPGAIEHRFAEYLDEIEALAARSPTAPDREPMRRGGRVVGDSRCAVCWCSRRSASRPRQRRCRRRSGFVSDFAGVHRRRAPRARSPAASSELKQKTGAEIAVVTLPTTQPDPVPERAVRLAEAWKPGDRDKDNGVLFLVAVEDRELFIATGYGIEGALPDGLVGEIRDRTIVPKFRARRSSRAASRPASIAWPRSSRASIASSSPGRRRPTRRPPRRFSDQRLHHPRHHSAGRSSGRISSRSNGPPGAQTGMRRRRLVGRRARRCGAGPSAAAASAAAAAAASVDSAAAASAAAAPAANGNAHTRRRDHEACTHDAHDDGRP